MALADLPHDLIDGGALRAALVAGDREGIRCEYKLKVHDSAEWCLDVTAFANTSGGVILVGAEEHEGRLVGLRGIDTNADDEVLRLENMLRDVVDPAIPGLRISPVDIDEGATVLVVSVPRSWRAPHLVRSTKRRWSPAKRNSAGKHVLGDASELRVAFSQTLDAGERARRWQEDLVAAVAAGQTPVRVDRDRFLVLSFRPIAAGAPGATPVLDVARARRDTSGPLSHAVFLYGSSISFGKRVDLDGVYIRSRATLRLATPRSSGTGPSPTWTTTA